MSRAHLNVRRYCFDNQTQRYTNLNTADRDAARQIVEAKNIALLQPALSREIGKATWLRATRQSATEPGRTRCGH